MALNTKNIDIIRAEVARLEVGGQKIYDALDGLTEELEYLWQKAEELQKLQAELSDGK